MNDYLNFCLCGALHLAKHMGAEKVKLKLKFQVLNLAKHMWAEKNQIQIKFQPQLFKSGHAVSFLAALAALYLTLVSQSVTEWVGATLEF